MALFDSSKTTQQQLTKSRWLNLLLPMGGIGLILFALIALLMNLSYHALDAIAEREVEERLLESASQMALQLTNELQQVEYHGWLLADQTEALLNSKKRIEAKDLTSLTQLIKGFYEAHDLISLAYVNDLNSVMAIFPKIEKKAFFFDSIDINNLDGQDSSFQYKSILTSTNRADEGRVFSLIYPVKQQIDVIAAVGLEINLHSLGRYLSKTVVPWSGYSLLMGTDSKLLAFPHHEKTGLESLNILDLPNLEPLRLDASGLIPLKLNGQDMLLSWASVTPTGWKLLNIAAAEKVFVVKNQLLKDYRLVLFCGGFFIVSMFLVLVYLVSRRDQQLMLNNQAALISNEALEPIVMKTCLNPMSVMDLIPGPLIVCQFDSEGLITSCNSAFEHLVGSTQNNLKGRHLLELLGLEKQTIDDAANEVELSFGQQDAMSYWISYHSSTEGDGLLLLLDVNEHKKIQQQLSGENQRARLASKMKAEFFQVAVNDANVLLLDLLQNARGLDTKLTNYCQSKLIELQHLLDNMRDMSDAGESDQHALTEDTLALRSLVDDCYTASQSLLANSGRRLLIEYGANIPENLILDRRRLFRLMRHLLRQMIQLSTRGDIYLYFGWNELGRLQVKVNDQGGGLIESERLRRFQLTTPLSSRYEAAAGGLGLGQLLTRQLIHEMRGTLEVKALPTGGLQLKIELPAKLVDDSIPLSLGRILVVDDGPVNSMLASSVLEKSGYAVDVAASGADALVLGLKHSYDLVLMDIFMPEMDGIETTRQWRLLSEAHAKVPVIALTANALDVEREDFLQQGLDDYLAKPYRPNELRELVKRWLEKK